jgi:hypothetical protein
LFLEKNYIKDVFWQTLYPMGFLKVCLKIEGLLTITEGNGCFDSPRFVS